MFVKKKLLFRDMSKVLEGYEGKWVALSIKEGQFVISGSGVTIGEAIEKARQKGVNDPILVRAPQESCVYIV
jgi:hypothetical protein